MIQAKEVINSTSAWDYYANVIIVVCSLCGDWVMHKPVLSLEAVCCADLNCEILCKWSQSLLDHLLLNADKSFLAPNTMGKKDEINTQSERTLHDSYYTHIHTLSIIQFTNEEINM